jgi:hypothetical protein
MTLSCCDGVDQDSLVGVELGRRAECEAALRTGWKRRPKRRGRRCGARSQVVGEGRKEEVEKEREVGSSVIFIPREKQRPARARALPDTGPPRFLMRACRLDFYSSSEL